MDTLSKGRRDNRRRDRGLLPAGIRLVSGPGLTGIALALGRRAPRGRAGAAPAAAGAPPPARRSSPPPLAAAAAAARGHGAAAAAAAPSGFDEILVTARNRSENAQDVPMPISVISGAQIDRDRAFTVADLTQRAPGLTATTPNARRTGVSIRGIGKTSGNDNMEAGGRHDRRRRVPRPRGHDVPGFHGPRARRDAARPARHAARQEHDDGRDQVHEPRSELHARRLVRRGSSGSIPAQTRRAARIRTR